MKMERDAITRLAEIAKLELSSEEKVEFSSQLSGIVDYLGIINELDTSGVEPAGHILELKNVLRPDFVTDSLPVEKIRSFSPEFEDGHVVVPLIIEDY